MSVLNYLKVHDGGHETLGSSCVSAFSVKVSEGLEKDSQVRHTVRAESGSSRIGRACSGDRFISGRPT